jgi:large subunit ribosomal protein L9
MKIILLKDVAKIGRKFDVKNVADGYALNFLIPRGSAKVATPESLKKIEAIKAELDAERKVQEDLLAKNLHEIDGKTATIKVKANEKGHLFAALHTAEIAHAIKESLGGDIMADFIALDHNIKQVGEHSIEIKAGGKSAKVKLSVEAE